MWLMDGLGDYLGSRTGGGRVGDLHMMEAGWYVDDGRIVGCLGSL